MTVKRITSCTLSRGKEFSWYYDGESLYIERDIKNSAKGEKNKHIDIWKNEDIDKLVNYISAFDEVLLSNNVEKVVNGTADDGIGKFIYDNIKQCTFFQQSSSQLVAIFYESGILNYNNQKRNMKFSIKNSEWIEKLKEFIIL